MGNGKCTSLCRYLQDSFGDDFVVESYDACTIRGYFFGKKILLTLGDNSSLQISSSDNEFRLLNMMVPSLIVFMDGKPPIARYCVIDLDNYKNNSCVMEWNKDVDNRLDELKKGGNFQDDRHIIRRFRPLVETRVERDKRLGFTTFSPCFFPNGELLDTELFSEMVNEYSEQDCFIVLSLLEGLQTQCWNKAWKGVSFDIVSLCDSIQIVRSKAENFYDKSSDEFDTWYKKWNDYFSYEKKCEYMEAKLNGEDTSSFVPVNSSLKKKKGWNLV